jgi:hypothetical protein
VRALLITGHAEVERRDMQQANALLSSGMASARQEQDLQDDSKQLRLVEASSRTLTVHQKLAACSPSVPKKKIICCPSAAQQV